MAYDLKLISRCCLTGHAQTTKKSRLPLREAGFYNEVLYPARSAVIVPVVVVVIRVRRTTIMRVMAHPFVALPVTVAVPITVAMPAEVDHHGGLHHVRLRISLLGHGPADHSVIDLRERSCRGQKRATGQQRRQDRA